MILYVDPFSGIAGDMFMGALVDAGVPFPDLVDGMGLLDTPGFRLRCSVTARGPIRATKVDVLLDRLGGRPEGLGEAHAHGGGGHGPPHGGGHGHDHSHGHGHPHVHAGEAEPRAEAGGDAPLHGTPLRALLERIAASRLPGPVKETASRIFHALGEGEAQVHGIPLDAVHFHEVGALDALVDVCGAAFLVHRLGVTDVVSAPVALGSGMIGCAHGRLPAPSPASVTILKDAPVRFPGVDGELTTPTGAAILRGLGARFGTPPDGALRATGYGAGTGERADPPNVLRVMLLEPGAGAPMRADVVLEIDCEVDDMTPEGLGFLRERLDAVPVLDFFVTPVHMKKNRPGHLLTVLCAEDRAAAAAETLFRHSSTFGLRRRLVSRLTLEREIRTVATRYGTARVKLGLFGGKVVKAAPEFEDCARLAREAGVPLDAVQRAVLEVYERRP